MKLSQKTTLYFGTFTFLAISSFLILNYFTVERSLFDKARQELRQKVESLNSAVNRMLNTSIQNYLRAIVDQETYILKDYYNRYRRGNLTERQAKNLYQMHAASHRIGETGYIGAVEQRGKKILLAIHPFMRGENCASSKVCQEWVKQKNGFNQYPWKNPKDKRFRWKVAYIRYFKPWNWVLGATSYKDEFYRLIDFNDLKEIIKPFKVLKRGYFFVLDEHCNMLIHPEIQGKNVSNVTNSRGVNITKRILKHQDQFFRYYWRNPSEHREHERFAYVKKIPNLKWYVVATGYMRDITDPIKGLMMTSYLLIFILTIILIILIYVFNRSLTSPLHHLIKGINDFYQNGTEFSLSFNSVDEINLVGHTIEKMTSSLIESDQERKSMEELLFQSRKMEAVGQLAGGVAHDFNNMLAGIIGAASLLEQRAELNIKNRELLQLILNSSERAADLTNQLLAFSRKGIVEMKDVDIHEIIHNTVSLLSRSLDRKIEIDIRENAASAIVCGDKSRLQTVLMNLCINAGQEMPDGGTIYIDTSNVSLSEEYCRKSSFNLEPGDYIVVSVRDEGSGIPKEIRDRIFEPFFTTKEQGKGTGLGLAAVYGIIIEHKGAISIGSGKEKGAEFIIYLQVSKTQDVQQPSENELITGEGRILVIDDEEVIRISVGSMLEELGYNVILAENGEEGLKIYREKKADIDLVILDMIMPVMNGKETFFELKKVNPDCKIIVATGFAKDRDVDLLFENGLSDAMVKPYRFFRLSFKVAAILRQGH